MRRPSIKVAICCAAAAGWSFEISAQNAAQNAHAYFNSLSARSEMIYSYSMRDQAELNHYAGGGISGDITYNPSADTHPERQDAAKVVVKANAGSIAKQVRFHTQVSSGAALFTWDAYWTRDYLLTGTLMRHKTFMVASPHDQSSRWINHMTRYNLGSALDIGRADYVISSSRYGPGVGEGPEEVLIPKLADFHIKVSTWTRFWTLVEFVPNGYDRLSYWVADATRDPVQIYNRVQVDSAGLIDRFWLEYNSSQARIGPPLVAYVRNLVVLQNVANPTALFQRPGSTGNLPPPTTTTVTPSAPSNLRISG